MKTQKKPTPTPVQRESAVEEALQTLVSMSVDMPESIGMIAATLHAYEGALRDAKLRFEALGRGRRLKAEDKRLCTSGVKTINAVLT